MLFFMELQRIMKKKKNLNFEKAVALVISALLLFSGCSSRSVTETSSTAVSEEISTEEKSDDEVLEDAIEMTSVLDVRNSLRECCGTYHHEHQ